MRAVFGEKDAHMHLIRLPLHPVKEALHAIPLTLEPKTLRDGYRALLFLRL